MNWLTDFRPLTFNYYGHFFFLQRDVKRDLRRYIDPHWRLSSSVRRERLQPPHPLNNIDYLLVNNVIKGYSFYCLSFKLEPLIWQFSGLNGFCRSTGSHSHSSSYTNMSWPLVSHAQGTLCRPAETSSGNLQMWNHLRQSMWKTALCLNVDVAFWKWGSCWDVCFRSSISKLDGSWLVGLNALRKKKKTWNNPQTSLWAVLRR